jgi:hypothetical protein
MLPSIVLQFILDVLWFSVLSFDAHRYNLRVMDPAHCDEREGSRRLKFPCILPLLLLLRLLELEQLWAYVRLKLCSSSTIRSQ